VDYLIPVTLLNYLVNEKESKRAQESEEGDEEGGDTEEQREKKARKRVLLTAYFCDCRHNEQKRR
jgi:hypothetical protein